MISSIASCNNAQAVHVGKVNQKTTQELKYGYNSLSSTSDYVNNAHGGGFTTEVERQINSLDDFIKNYDYLNPPSFEEYCDEQLNGVKRDIDYRGEFNKYLRERNCSNVSELTELNKTDFYSSNQLKESVLDASRSMLSRLSQQGLYNGDVWNDSQYIYKNASLSAMTNFVNNASRPMGNEYLTDMNNFKCLNDLVSSLQKDRTGKFKPKDIINASDKMIEILKEKNGNSHISSFQTEREQAFNNTKDFIDLESSRNIKSLAVYALD